MNFRLTQTHLIWAAVGLLGLVVNYWIWSSALEPINRDLETLPKERDKVAKSVRDAEGKRDKEKDLYLVKKAEWTAKHEKELAAARAEAAADWQELTRKAKEETAGLRGKTAAARAALAVDRTEVQLQSEIRRQMNELCQKHDIADADRQVNVTSRVNTQTGWLEITIQFQFKAKYLSAEAMFREEIEKALPFMAIDALKAAAVEPKAGAPESVLGAPMTLSGTIIGYVYPAGAGR